MVDQYRDALEDLERLYASGQVSQAQYDLHKARLLAEATQPRSPRWKPWAIAVGAILLIAIIGWFTSPHPTSSKTTSSSRTSTSTTSYKPSAPSAVLYDVTGSATSADITYATPSGNSQQQGVDVPLMMKSGSRGMSVSGFKSGDFLYISAQNTGEFGSVKCQIKVDGTVVAENTASGAYAIASCKGSL